MVIWYVLVGFGCAKYFFTYLGLLAITYKTGNMHNFCQNIDGI